MWKSVWHSVWRGYINISLAWGSVFPQSQCWDDCLPSFDTHYQIQMQTMNVSFNFSATKSRKKPSNQQKLSIITPMNKANASSSREQWCAAAGRISPTNLDITREEEKKRMVERHNKIIVFHFSTSETLLSVCYPMNDCASRRKKRHNTDKQNRPLSAHAP